jgi:hypothetical protein
VRAVVNALRAQGAAIRSGGDWDRWDVEVRGGLLGVVRLRLAVEEHGGGRQVVRIRSWPHVRRGAAALLGLVAAVAALTAASPGREGLIAILVLTAALLARLSYEWGTASATIRHALSEMQAAVDVQGREEEVTTLTHLVSQGHHGSTSAQVGRGARDAA